MKKKIYQLLSLLVTAGVTMTFIIGQQTQKDSPGSVQNRDGTNYAQTQVNSPNSNQTINVDLPATYSETHIIEKNKNIDWPYKTTITIVSNKNTNLPHSLCFFIKTDVQLTSNGKNPILNVGDPIKTSNISNYDNGACIANPSTELKSIYLLKAEPKNLTVQLKYN